MRFEQTDHVAPAMLLILLKDVLSLNIIVAKELSIEHGRAREEEISVQLRSETETAQKSQLHLSELPPCNGMQGT